MNALTLRVAARFAARTRGILAAGRDTFKIFTNAGYKDVTGIQRIPIAKIIDPKTKETRVLVGNDALDEAGVRVKGKPYMSDEKLAKLFGDEVVIEEKVDGHPTIVIYGGYTFFCEALQFRHTVKYDGVPFSLDGWPDYTVVYDVIDGEKEPPYKQSGENWLARDEKESLCNMVGAPLVPLVFKGKIKPEDVPALANRLSGFASESKAEGVVIKNHRAGVFGKFINLEFQRAISDESLWGGVHPMQRKEKQVRRFES